MPVGQAQLREQVPPQPSQEALRLFPEELAGLVGVPSFIVYRLRFRP